MMDEMMSSLPPNRGGYMKPESVVSSSGYVPIKSEETDDEELGDKDTNTSMSIQPINIKKEESVKIEDDEVSTDDESGSETKEPIRRRKSPRLTSRLGASIQESIAIQRTAKKRRRRSKGMEK